MLTKKTFFIKRWAKKEKVTAHILDFPHILQPNDAACAQSCVLAILRYYGNSDVRETKLEKKLKMDPIVWTDVLDIMKYLKKESYKIDAREMTLADLENYIKKGIPVIALIQARSKRDVDYTKTQYQWHYVTVIGYNAKYIFFSDPIFYNVWYLPKKEFVARRHEKEDDGRIYHNFGIAVYGRTPKYDPQELRKIS